MGRSRAVPNSDDDETNQRSKRRRVASSKETLVQEIYKGNIANKSDAHGLFKVDQVKVDGVYDMVKKKLGQQEEPTVV